MTANVIFDLDGTLVDSIPGIQRAIDAALASCGLPALSCDLKPLIGPPIRKILETVSGVTDDRNLDLMESTFRAVYDSSAWRETACQPGTEIAVRGLLSGGCRLWVVTNKPGHAARAILTELALAECFREIVSRDSRTPRFASKAEMLNDLLERCALDRANCIMVGDTLEDGQAAAEAGIECALLPHGYGGGLDQPLPEHCRLITGWDELLERCMARDAMDRHLSRQDAQKEPGNS